MWGLLLQSGADPNAKGRDGWTCLMRASRDTDYEATKLLLEGGADLYAGACEITGHTALSMSHYLREGRDVHIRVGETWQTAFEKIQRVAQLLDSYHARQQGAGNR